MFPGTWRPMSTLVQAAEDSLPASLPLARIHACRAAGEASICASGGVARPAKALNMFPATCLPGGGSSEPSTGRNSNGNTSSCTDGSGGRSGGDRRRSAHEQIQDAYDSWRRGRCAGTRLGISPVDSVVHAGYAADTVNVRWCQCTPDRVDDGHDSRACSARGARRVVWRNPCPGLRPCRACNDAHEETDDGHDWDGDGGAYLAHGRSLHPAAWAPRLALGWSDSDRDRDIPGNHWRFAPPRGRLPRLEGAQGRRAHRPGCGLKRRPRIPLPPGRTPRRPFFFWLIDGCPRGSAPSSAGWRESRDEARGAIYIPALPIAPLAGGFPSSPFPILARSPTPTPSNLRNTSSRPPSSSPRSSPTTGTRASPSRTPNPRATATPARTDRPPATMSPPTTRPFTRRSQTTRSQRSRASCGCSVSSATVDFE